MMTTLEAVQLGIPRWMVMSHLSDDVAQEVAIAALLGRTEAQRRDALRYRLRELRRTQWERRPCKPARLPSSLRPSKIRSVSGYRTDSAAHKTARQKVNAEQRRAIARKGQQAWRDANFSGAS